MRMLDLQRGVLEHPKPPPDAAPAWCSSLPKKLPARGVNAALWILLQFQIKKNGNQMASMLTELVFETVSTLLKLFFQDFLFAIVQGYGGLVLNQDIGPNFF